MLRDPALHPLSHQHQHGLALCVIIRRTLAEADSEEIRAELARKVKAAWDLELEPHFAIEEQILFPAVRGRIDQPQLVDQLVGEHQEIEQRVRDLLANPEDFRLWSFSTLLNDHIRTEERRLFPQIQEHLDTEELAALGRRLDSNLTRICPSSTELPWERPA